MGELISWQFVSLKTWVVSVVQRMCESLIVVCLVQNIHGSLIFLKKVALKDDVSVFPYVQSAVRERELQFWMKAKVKGPLPLSRWDLV